MSFFSDFIGRKKIDVFAQKTGKQFTQRLPPHRATDEKRFSAEFEIALSHIQGFHRTEKLGTFGKARLINGFQWALIDNGYDKNLSHKIGRDVALRLTAHKPDQD